MCIACIANIESIKDWGDGNRSAATVADCPCECLSRVGVTTPKGPLEQCTDPKCRHYHDSAHGHMPPATAPAHFP